MANENNLASQIKNAFPPVSEKPAASSGANDRVASFARSMAPIAERVSAETGVDPAVLIGQWGLETGWGKSVIPGTNNFGNIKDFRGSGVTARDNMNGSVDKYRAYESPEDFGGHFAQLLKTGRYKGALGALDAQSYFSALKAGGYAEDPNYVRSGVKAADMVKRVMGEGRPAASIYPERGEYIGQTEKVQERTRRQEAADESPLSTSLGRGFEGLKHNVGLFAENLAGDSDAAAERIRAKREWDEANPAPSSSEKFTQQWQSLAEDDYSGMLGAALSNPGGMLNQMVEQTPNSLPGLALQIPTAIASGALLATGWGAPIAIGLQGLAAFAGNVMPEGGAIIEEHLAKSGVNPNDTAAVAKWIADNRSANIEGGVKKAGVISLVDGATGYLGAKMIAGPAVRYAKAEQAALANAGINLSDKAAVAAARATPAYKQAMAVPAKELLDATTRAQKTVRELGGVGLETVGEGVGEYAGSYAANGEASVKDAVLESLMGAGNSAAMTGANMATAAMRKPEIDRAALGALAATPVQPVIKQNSPLSNMASVGQAAQANSAPAMPSLDGETPGMQGAQASPAADGGNPLDSLFAARDNLNARIAGINNLLSQAAPGSPEFQGLRNKAQQAASERDSIARQIDAATAFGAINPSAVPRERGEDPLSQRLEATRGFVEDKELLRALRTDPRYGKESVTELLAAWAKARNPNLDVSTRERALNDIDGFTSSFVGPNTLNPKGQSVNLGGERPSGQSVAPFVPQGGAVGPAIRRPDGRTLDGEIITRPEGMAGANPNQLSAPPVLGLPTEEALQAKRQADADYEQAYQDLVKAEQLGASDAEIAAYQRTLLEADRLRRELESQIADADTRAADAQRREAEARRREILASVIGQGIPGVNPVADVSNRFKAELMRQGYRDTEPTEAETQSILRAVDVANAREDGPLPSLPNEGDFYAPPKAQRTAPPKAESKPKQQPNRRLTPKEIREYVAAGAILNGDTLTLPDGTVLKLKGPQIAAAREAMRKVAPAQVESAPAQANESEGFPQDSAPQQVESPAAVSENPAETPDVSTRTDDQLRYLANNGKPGWKEAAQAEMARREGAKPEIRSDLDAAAHEAATSPLNDTPQPTDGQKSAGNYKVGRVRVQGMDISIENPKGSVRSGTSPDGRKWESTLHAHYGHFTGTKAADGDHLDVYLTDGAEDAPMVWVIDQKNANGTFDEHKTLLGPRTEEEAKAAYLANYEPGWDGIGAISSMPIEAFKAWAFDGKKKRKPLVYVEPDGGALKADEVARIIHESIAENAIKNSVKYNEEGVSKGRVSREVADASMERTRQDWAKSPINDRTVRLAKAIVDKEPRILVGAWAKEGQGTYGNEGSMNAFEKITGVKLRRLNSAQRAKAIFDWAGWSEEQVAEDVSRRRAEQEELKAQRQEKDDKATADQAERAQIKIRETGEVKTVREYIDGLIADGYTEIRTAKRGAVTKTVLANAEGWGRYLSSGIVKEYAVVASRRALDAKASGQSNPVTTTGDEEAEAPATAQPDPREAYANQKAEAYIAQRGGNAPPKAVEAVRIGARKEFDKGQDKQSKWISLDEYVKSHPNVRETRARNAWASDISDAITEGKDIPPTIVDELLEKMPGFAPDAIASRDVLMDRYKQAIDTDIERAIERLREEHANLAKKLDHKRVKTSHEKYVEVRDQLISLNDRIHALEQERRDRARGDFTTETAAEDYLVRRLVQLSGVSEEDAKTRIVRATVSAQPTHQDPGEPAEAATPAVVAKSIQKSARNTEFNPADAKKWLLGEIDKAVANVPAENTELAAELAREKAKTFDPQGRSSAEQKEFYAVRDSNIAKIVKQIGFVTFDVPGDGKFKVMNTIDGLNNFRSKVEKSPGFARPTAPRSGRSMPGGPSLDESIADAKKNGGSVLSELGNAIEISRLRGKEDDTLLDRFKENSGGKSYDEWRAEQEAAEEIAAREEAERSQTPSEKEADDAKRETRSEVAQPSDLTNIFTGLSARGLAKTRAQKAAQAHPRAEQIAYVQDNFLDIMTELEDSGIVKINCD